MNPNEMASGLLRMDWITQIFWTIDMLMSLLTGYVHEGEGPYLSCSGPTGVVITKPSMILKNYLSLGSKLQLRSNSLEAEEDLVHSGLDAWQDPCW